MLKNKSYLYLIIFILVFRTFLVPGIRVASDFPYVSMETIKEGFNIPQTWSDRSSVNLGEYVLHTLWIWPIDLIFGLGGLLGISFSFLERILGIIPILILGTWAISNLLAHFRVRGYGKLIGIIVYMLNTYILLIIDGGQISIGLAYSWLPYTLLSVLKSINSGLRDSLLAGLSIIVLGFLDIRYIFILFILLLLYFLYKLVFVKKRKLLEYIWSWIKEGFKLIIIYLGFNAYWIIPSLFSQNPSLPHMYVRSSQISFLNFTKFKYAVSLLQPQWYLNVFGKISEFRKEFLLIPILALFMPILNSFSSKYRRSKKIGFWLLVAIVGVFLVKGINTPFPKIYPWLFIHVPLFSLFRDPTKFFVLVTLSYSVLIGCTVDEIYKKLSNLKLKKYFVKSSIFYPKLFIFFLIIYFLLLISPIWFGKMTGMFSSPPNQKSFSQIEDILNNDKFFNRVIWLPSKASLGFSSPLHPSVDAIGIVQKRPFGIGVVGNYEILNFIREAPFIGEIFKISGIKYISYPYPDTRRQNLKQDDINYYFTFLDQMTDLPWIEKKLADYPTPLLQVKDSKDRFFIIPNTYLVIGSDRIYNNLIKLPDFDLSKNALIFAEEGQNVLDNLDKAPFSNIILYEKNKLDLAGSLIDKKFVIFPAQNLDFDPTKENPWWKRETIDFLWIRNFLQEKYQIDNQDFDYGGGLAISEGNNNLNIENNILLKDDILLARVLKSSRGGKISFFQGNNLIGEINTKNDRPEKVEIKLTGHNEVPDIVSEYDKADFNWYIVGRLKDDSKKIEIETEGDINIVNSIASLSEKEWNHTNRVTAPYNIIYWDKFQDKLKEEFVKYKDNATLSYQKISPTHYKVKVSGVRKSVTLAFSETYDDLWQANKVGSYPIYSLINGFKIESDGEYDIYFSPQKYVLPGLIISGLVFLSVIYLLARTRNTKNRV